MNRILLRIANDNLSNDINQFCTKEYFYPKIDKILDKLLTNPFWRNGRVKKYIDNPNQYFGALFADSDFNQLFSECMKNNNLTKFESICTKFWIQYVKDHPNLLNYVNDLNHKGRVTIYENKGIFNKIPGYDEAVKKVANDFHQKYDKIIEYFINIAKLYVHLIRTQHSNSNEIMKVQQQLQNAGIVLMSSTAEFQKEINNYAQLIYSVAMKINNNNKLSNIDLPLLASKNKKLNNILIKKGINITFTSYLQKTATTRKEENVDTFLQKYIIEPIAKMLLDYKAIMKLIDAGDYMQISDHIKNFMQEVKLINQNISTFIKYFVIPVLPE